MSEVWTQEDLRRYRQTGVEPGQVGAASPAKSGRSSKYNVGPRHLRQCDGYTFDSIAERKRYEELRLREKAGEISELRVHPSWSLVLPHPRGEADIVLGEYEADFAYRLVVDRTLSPPGPLYVEDVKGVRTPVYQLKRRLMLALHSIEVTEVEVR